MGRLPRPSGKELLTFLQKQGFMLLRVRGSHHFLERGSKHTCVPIHGNRSVRIGTLHSILRDIEMAPQEFAKLWRA